MPEFPLVIHCENGYKWLVVRMVAQPSWWRRATDTPGTYVACGLFLGSDLL